jgi:hypothetical protein
MGFVNINEYFKALEALPPAQAEKKILQVEKKLAIAKSKIQKLPKLNDKQLAMQAYLKTMQPASSAKGVKPLTMKEIDTIKHKVRQAYAK